MDAILANRWDDLRRDGYDVLVVGSGYGGAITAARLANTSTSSKPTVCILERGREWPIGSFPDSLPEILLHTHNEIANPLGLYEFDLHRDIAVIKGNGLGGTSLVNANVAVRPDAAVFQGWPAAINRAAQRPEGTPGSLWDYYRLAEKTLDVSPHPEADKLKKVQALQRRAAQLGKTAVPLNLAVNFQQEGVTAFASGGQTITRRRCIDCGDCMTGCNVGAKNTLYMNYLPLAKTGGAHIFTQTEVEYIENAGDNGWIAHVRRRENLLEGVTTTIRARRLILAAGALGSTKILLRSQQHGLGLSPRVGTGFGGNGDFFGLAYNSTQITDSIGWGNHPDDPIARQVRPGPSIVAIISYGADGPVAQRFSIEDLSIPRAYRDAAAVAFRLMGGTDANPAVSNPTAEQARRNKDEFGADPGGALNSSMLYLCMGQDDSGGALSLNAQGKLQLDWPSVGAAAIFKRINSELFDHAHALNAPQVIEDPLWHVSPCRTLLTAHPLGGCRMGEEGSDGAVDHLGRVFLGAGVAVHDGLYVSDGSVVRTALIVNPFLTISALAERIAEHISSELRS
jgi:cholesterol oxidase